MAKKIVGVGNGFGTDGKKVYKDCQVVANLIVDPNNRRPSIQWIKMGYYDPALLDLVREAKVGPFGQ